MQPSWFGKAAFGTRYGVAVTVPEGDGCFGYRYLNDRNEASAFIDHLVALRDEKFPVSDEGSGA